MIPAEEIREIIESSVFTKLYELSKAQVEEIVFETQEIIGEVYAG